MEDNKNKTTDFLAKWFKNKNTKDLKKMNPYKIHKRKFSLKDKTKISGCNINLDPTAQSK